MKSKLIKFIKKYSLVTDEQANILADYALATWQPVPSEVRYLHITSDSKSGNSIVGRVMENICQYPLVADGQCTYLSLRNELNTLSPVTLIVKEGALPRIELRQLLEFGWHKNYSIIEMVEAGEGVVPTVYKVHGYKIILGELPFFDPGILTRCIPVALENNTKTLSCPLTHFSDDAIEINHLLRENSPDYITQYDLSILDDFDTDLYDKDRRRMTPKERLQVDLANILFTSVADARSKIGSETTKVLRYALALVEKEGGKTITKILRAELKRRDVRAKADANGLNKKVRHGDAS